MMKCKKLFAGALAVLLGAPAFAQNGNVVLSGSLIDWYYYGRPYTGDGSGDTWNQQPTGLGTVENPYNYGLISIGANAAATDGKPVWVAGFPIRNHLLYGNAGGVYDGANYYSFFMHETESSSVNMDSEYGSETYEVVVRKWNLETGTYQQVATMSTQPIDLCYDPLWDKVYGIFYSGSSYKFGTLDMETFRVSYFSREGIVYGAPRCLAINSQGVLYAIDATGWVYTVNKENGELTTVGHTGVSSQDRMMSATIDLRTDKLYWIGFMNNGKIDGANGSGTNETRSVADGGRDTGVYEVNTTTGEATLIGATNFVDINYTYDANGQLTGATTRKYGKMQITGLYVEGSFSKKDVDQMVEIVSAPSQLRAGEQGSVRVRVKNIGLNKVLAKNYVLNLYANGQKVATIDRDSEPDPLDNQEPNQQQTLTIPFTAPAAAGQLTLYAEVENAADEELRNNKSAEKTIVVLGGKSLPTVELSGTARQNAIKLQWADPKGHVTDGAEQYAAFTYDGLNDWTMIDGDQAYTQSLSSWNDAVSYPNKNTPKAFIVFNPEKAGVYLTNSITQFTPHTGEQYFAAFFSAVPDDSEAGGHQVANDDWMISPELSGEAQTISFWAKGYKGSVSTGYETEANYPETMEVLYSTATAGDYDLANFDAKAKEQFTVNNEAWTLYTASLPAGATHFALHCTSAEGFVLLIDDISFQVKPQTVTGYNVYKNGALIATLGADETSWTSGRFDTVEADDLFTVTALYANGESAHSNPVSINIINSIDEIRGSQQGGALRIYDLNGRAVRGQLRPGLYLLQQNGRTRKVVVK